MNEKGDNDHENCDKCENNQNNEHCNQNDQIINENQ